MKRSLWLWVLSRVREFYTSRIREANDYPDKGKHEATCARQNPFMDCWAWAWSDFRKRYPTVRL